MRAWRTFSVRFAYRMEKGACALDSLEQLEGQGISPHLIEGVRRYRAAYPWKGPRPVCMPRYSYDGREVLEAAIAALLAGENLLLSGPKATGKNVLAENLAAIFARPDWNISFHINMDAAYLIGMDTFEAGAVRFRPGPVHACAEAGGFAILDEINMARNEALAVLHSLLDYRRSIDVPGYDRLKVHDATRFIATMNYGYAGTRELNEALASRFVVLQMPTLDEAGITRLLAKGVPGLRGEAYALLAALFADLEEKAGQGEISGRAIDLRGLLDALRLMQEGVAPLAAVTMGITNKCFDPDERQLVADTVALRVPKEGRIL